MRYSSLILIGLLVLPMVLGSAGIRPPTIEERTLTFSPGLTKTWSFSVFGAPRIEAFVGGDLAEYMVLEDPAPNTSSRIVEVTLTLPDELEPGRYASFLYSRESSSGGMIGARAAVGAGILVFSLYPTPYLDAKLSVGHTSVGTNTAATLTLQSWAQVLAPDVYADLTVKNADGETVSAITTQHIAIAPQEKKVLTTPLPTSTLAPGRYTVDAVIHGAQPNLTAFTSFRVGTFDLSLIDYTKKLGSGQINRFTYSLSSNWNEPIPDVYGAVSVGNMQEKTLTVTISSFGDASFKAYLDATTLNVTNGTVLNGSILAYYPGPEGEELTKNFPITVAITSELLPETVPLPEELQEPWNFSIPINAVMLLYLALFLLIIINLYFLFWKKHEDKQPPKE